MSNSSDVKIDIHNDELLNSIKLSAKEVSLAKNFIEKRVQNSEIKEEILISLGLA